MESYYHSASGTRYSQNYDDNVVRYDATHRAACKWLTVRADGKNPPDDRRTPTELRFTKQEYGPLEGQFERGMTFYYADYGIQGRTFGQVADSANTAPAIFLQSDKHLPLLGFSDANLYNRCLDGIYRNVQQGSQLNIAVDLAEAHELARLHTGITDAVFGVIDFARKARKKALVEGGRSLVKGLSSAWLSYQYGWRPLLSTIHGLAHHARTKYGIHTIRSRASQESSWVAFTSDDWMKRCDLYGDSSIRYECKVHYTVDDDSTLSVKRVTSLDPTRLAWELLPYSFVVDWFWDIGGFLEALEARRTSGLSFHNGYLTKTQLHKIRGSWTDPGGPTYPIGYSQEEYTANFNLSQQVSHSVLDREVLTTFPYPRLPSLTTDLGSGQLKNGAALLARLLL